MSKVVKLGSGDVELSRPSRRRFSAGYKLKILEEADACSLSGQIGPITKGDSLKSTI